MSITNQGFNLLPGMHDDRFTQESQIYWGRWDQIQYIGVVLDKDIVDTGNDPDQSLRKGLAVGKQTATGQILQWDPYATDGTQYLLGFLMFEQDTRYGTGTKERLNYIMVKGNVKAASVVIPGEANAGLDLKTYEFLLRDQAAQRFLFDDDTNNYQGWKERTITSLAASAGSEALTILPAMNRTRFVLSAAADTDWTGTIDTDCRRPGFELEIVNANTTAGTEMILEGEATGEYWVAGAAANSVTEAGDTSTLRRLKCVRTNATGPVYSYVMSAAT